MIYMHHDETCGFYPIKMKHSENGFTPYQLKIRNNKENKYREIILKKIFPLKEQWKEIKEIDLFFGKVFYIKKNSKFFVLKKSLELYEKYGTGLFWIGNDKIFELSENSFYNSLCTYNIHFLKDFTIEINYNNKEWRSFDAGKYLSFNSFDDFIQMNFYGYGGLLWKNGNKIPHEFIYNNSKIGRNENKIFCDDCHVEIENEINHKCRY